MFNFKIQCNHEDIFAEKTLNPGVAMWFRWGLYKLSLATSVHGARESRDIVGLSAYESTVIKADNFKRTSTPSTSPAIPRHPVEKIMVMRSSRKLLRIKVTPDLHLTYSKNGGNLGLVLKMENIACITILLAKHVKYTYLYLFKFVLYSIVTFKAN